MTRAKDEGGTPRVDAFYCSKPGWDETGVTLRGVNEAWATFARTLERELAEAKERNESLLLSNQLIREQQKEDFDRALAAEQARDEARRRRAEITGHLMQRTDDLQASESSLATMREEVEKLRKDAQRYRWLREQYHDFHVERWTKSTERNGRSTWISIRGRPLDTAIDTALTAHLDEGGKENP